MVKPPRWLLVTLMLLAAVVALAACGSGGATTGLRVPTGEAVATSLIARCPKEAPVPAESMPSAGKKGHTVPAGPTAALVCRWSASHGRENRAKGSVRGAKLAKFVGVLDSLPEIEEGEETEGCGGGPSVPYLVALGYPGEAEVQVLAYLGEGEFCDSATNLADNAIYVGSDDLKAALDKILTTPATG